MFFWKKERQIEQHIEQYLLETEQCLDTFGQALDVYFADGLTEQFTKLVEQTHAHEQASDVLRRDIEAKMYGKALIPESRGDVLGMLEALDLVPNQCESVLYQIWTQSMIVPARFVDQLRPLVQINIEAGHLLYAAMRDLFGDIGRIPEGAGGVTAKEGASDTIERILIKAIFDSDLDKADKILLKELVLEIGSISDRAENAADRLRNIAVKRQS